MSRRAIFLITLLCTCWIPILLAAIAVSFQARRITAQSSEYSTIGRIVVQRDSADLPPAASKQTPTETLESSELKLRTLERLRALHPEVKKTDVKIQVTQLKDIDVMIRVMQTKGSSILNVSATGSDPKYTRIYLEALLDEFIGLRKEMEVPTDQETILQRPEPAVEVIPDLWGPLLIWALVGISIGVFLMLFIAFIAMRLMGKKNRLLPNPQ